MFDIIYGMRMILKDDMVIMRRFFKLVKLHPGYVAGLVLSSVFGHGMDLLLPVLGAGIIQSLTAQDVVLTYWHIGGLLMAYVGYDVAWSVNYWFYAKNHNYSYQHLRAKLMDKILKYDVDFAERQPKGLIVNTVNGDVSNLAVVIDEIVEMTVRTLKLLIVVVVFLWTNVWIGMAVVAVGYVYARLADGLNVRTARSLAAQLKYRDKMTDMMGQTLSGLSEVKAFNLYSKVLHNFDIISRKWSNYYMQKWVWKSLNLGLLPLLMHVFKVMMFLGLSVLVFRGELELGALIFLTNYFSEMRGSIDELMKSSLWLRERAVSIDRVRRILDYRGGEKLEFGNLKQDEVDGVVRFSRVGFRYKGENAGSVAGVSFVAEPNEITALVGHSGSGKSTLVGLLMRRYPVSTGRITLDGKDILRYTEKTYASNVAMVDQTPFMFNMSIRKNLAMVDGNFERQKEACRRVGIHEMIMNLPSGYNTVLAENAGNFSGGQKQLLAIARTLLTNAEVLVFDEVTSALDVILVERMKALFEDLKQDHTIIMVTHKRDMMRLADKIVVMEQGRMVGCGTHEELMRENQTYINIQTHSYIEEVVQEEEMSEGEEEQRGAVKER